MSDYKPNGKSAAEHLIGIAKNIEEIKPIITDSIDFGFCELKDLSSETLTKRITEKVGTKYQSIYSFHLNKDASSHEFQKAFKNARDTKLQGRAYARDNMTSEDRKSNNCFYVGTSQKTASRLKEHLGLLNSKSTYSLHMRFWAAELDGGFEIRVHKFKLDDDEIILLPYLEDQFAWKLNPMFGRRGSL